MPIATLFAYVLYFTATYSILRTCSWHEQQCNGHGDGDFGA